MKRPRAESNKQLAFGSFNDRREVAAVIVPQRQVKDDLNHHSIVPDIVDGASENASGAPYEFAADGDDGTGSGIPDGEVTLADYEYWVSQFGTVVGTGAAIAVPEPGAGLLMLLAIVIGVFHSRALF